MLNTQLSAFKKISAQFESLAETTLLILFHVLQLEITPCFQISIDEPLFHYQTKESTVFQNTS